MESIVGVLQLANAHVKSRDQFRFVEVGIGNERMDRQAIPYCFLEHNFVFLQLRWSRFPQYKLGAVNVKKLVNPVEPFLYLHLGNLVTPRLNPG